MLASSEARKSSAAMNNFKIYIDDENAHVRTAKDKDFLQAGKRPVLGQLQNTIPCDGIGELLKRKEVHTGFTETIKALDIKEKESRKFNNIKCGYLSPLKDVQKPTTHKNVEPPKSYSPIAIDAEPTVSDKENLSLKEESQTSESSTPTKVSESIPQNFSRLDIYGCYSYYDAIYKYMRKQEELFKPKAFYMRRQPDISYSMRTILVDWLVEVGEEYKLHNETLFKSVAYIDRFLSSMAVARPKLQLLGTCAMFIASKFEEIFPPGIEEFIYITDDSYTTKQVLRMERLILKVLCFDLSSPTSYTFLLHIAAKADLASKVCFLAMYICELTLLEADPYLEFCPSLISCGAIALAKRSLGCGEVWPNKLVDITGYTLSQLGPVITHLNETHRKSFTLAQTAIRQKYKTAKYQHVSDVPYKPLTVRDSFALP